ncbi:MAG TPA: histidine ammonia-lyase [Chitinophagaceae bacterium]|nr:histidine ammonia-lyase [Chitinophagaceae bacterium]HMZ46052.1 histidine ammonia-lyase [Chitinophagaceae bacterium]HNE92911.1 histidine ammonia-lyase [Chitinophagaceae bacterium]HNM34063.1 histidine ammonia-lyase [Chitinophagaceae bacterium]HNN31045.1 histidine ammonia-lyase [Chitinophagaceae bacterium]
MATKNVLNIDNSWLSFDEVKQFITQNSTIAISNQSIQLVLKCRNFLDEKMANNNALFYGINTGFGFLQNVKIDANQIEQLQYNLLMSHACGMGNEVPTHIVRLMLLLKIKSLSYGNSGVQLNTINALATLCNNNILPIVFMQGSLGASGDLAPLSHLCLPLIGMGEVQIENEKFATKDILNKLGFNPVALKSKEGLALINGTQFMSAYGMYCLYKAERLLRLADIIAAISFDAFNCVKEPLHPAIHHVRKHKGQVATAASLRKLLEGSEISNQPKKQVQDAYSFRCIPQVHGASKDVFENVLEVFLTEINSVTDNPNVFPDEDLIVSGGNFHGQPLALRLDFLSIAMSEIGNISERRTYQLISGLRELPAFLVNSPGLNSGFMIPQYTAAGIVSENKQLCTPASVDSISSSNNQEDHVSMGANAATKCMRVVDNVERVLAIELLTAAQALDFRRPAKTSPILEKFVAAFREKVSFNEQDRILHTDMIAAVEFLRTVEITNEMY